MPRCPIPIALAVAFLIGVSLSPAGASAQVPGTTPAGANDWSCKPSPGHTRPVVLVHGTFLDMSSWSSVSPVLAADGYCVFALNYGGNAVAPVPESAKQVKAFIEKVLHATGARKVAIVGHSQGGMIGRWIVKKLGGAKLIAEIVGLSPSNHGTTQPLAPPLGATACPSCKDQAVGSKFMTELNSGDDSPGRKLSYTVLQTRYDEVVTPFANAFLAPSPKVTNVLVQDKCPLEVVDHVAMIYDAVVLQWIENALARQGKPADPDFEPDC
jgi:pimeloyl-ACP methyl ester carboxylesterase